MCSTLSRQARSPGRCLPRARVLCIVVMQHDAQQLLLVQDLTSWTRDGIAGLQSVVLYSLPELDGAIDTVPLGGLMGNNIFLVPERVKRLSARLRKWVSLRRTPKHVSSAPWPRSNEFVFNYCIRRPLAARLSEPEDSSKAISLDLLRHLQRLVHGWGGRDTRQLLLSTPRRGLRPCTSCWPHLVQLML